MNPTVRTRNLTLNDPISPANAIHSIPRGMSCDEDRGRDVHEKPEVCPVCGTANIDAIQRQSVVKGSASPAISGVVGYRCENGHVSIAPKDSDSSEPDHLDVAA